MFRKECKSKFRYAIKDSLRSDEKTGKMIKHLGSCTHSPGYTLNRVWLSSSIALLEKTDSSKIGCPPTAGLCSEPEESLS